MPTLKEKYLPIVVLSFSAMHYSPMSAPIYEATPRAVGVALNALNTVYISCIVNTIALGLYALFAEGSLRLMNLHVFIALMCWPVMFLLNIVYHDTIETIGTTREVTDDSFIAIIVPLVFFNFVLLPGYVMARERFGAFQITFESDA